MLFTAIKDIWEAFREYTNQAILYGFVATIAYLIAMIVVFLLRVIKKKDPYSFWHVLLKTGLFAILGIYISYVVSLTLSGREIGSRVKLINLVPFKTIALEGRLSITEFENVVLFMPLGFLVPFVWKYFRGIFRTVLIGFTVSVLIEITQLYTERGYCDIDDVILNTIGTFLGYIVFAGIYYGLLGIKRRLLTDVAKRCKIPPPLGKMYDRLPLRYASILFTLQVFPAYLWANIIMGFSSDNGDESGGMSKLLLGKILKLLGIARDITAEVIENSSTLLMYEKVLRKMAHMFEYGVLAVLVWAAIYSLRKVFKIVSFGIGLLAAFVVGVIDETNQMSVAGRTGIFTDVLWDSFGALLALMLVGIIIRIVSNHYMRKYMSINRK